MTDYERTCPVCDKHFEGIFAFEDFRQHLIDLHTPQYDS